MIEEKGFVNVLEVSTDEFADKLKVRSTTPRLLDLDPHWLRFLLIRNMKFADNILSSSASNLRNIYKNDERFLTKA